MDLVHPNFGAVKSAFGALHTRGVTLEQFQSLGVDTELADRVAETLKGINPKPDPLYDAYRVSELLDLNSSSERLTSFLPPPDRAVGYVTFFDPGCSFAYLQKLLLPKKMEIRCPWRSGEENKWEHQKEAPAYRQIRADAIPGSFLKTHKEQAQMLGEYERLPLMRWVTTMVVIHFLATGERLFPTYYVECDDPPKYVGRTYSLGRFKARSINGHCHERRNHLVGLAPCRVFPALRESSA